MELRIFLGGKIVALTHQASGQYTDSKYEPGTFSVTVPSGARYAAELQKDRIVLIDRWYYGTITGVKVTDADSITIAGSQLTEWLHRRVIVPPVEQAEDAPMGYDAESGATETIMKRAVEKHAVSPRNGKRAIPGLSIAYDAQRGIANDAYLYRYAYLDEAVIAMGKRANLGIKIDGYPSGNYVFDVIPRLDRTVTQTERPPLILDVRRHTADTAEYSDDASASANTFFCTRSDSAEVWEKLTQTYFLEDAEPQGLDRREMALTISVPDGDNPYEQMEITARKEMENYRPAQTLTCTMSRRLEYRTDYSLGDYCTVVVGGYAADMEIVSVTTTEDEGGRRYTATFGEQAPTKWDLLSREKKGRSIV